MRKFYERAFWTTLFVSLALIIGGFFCPPMGEIDGSVLTAVGLLFLWPTLAFAYNAVEDGKTAKFVKGDMSIEIGDDNNNEENEDE